MDDNIVQEWDASTSGALCYNAHTKIVTSRLAALARHLDRSNKVTYDRMLHLHKSDTERLRLSASVRSRKGKWNPIHNPVNNPINNPVNNPINNVKRHDHDKAMTWKVKQTLLDDHSPPAETRV